jgi:hypothetical protein
MFRGHACGVGGSAGHMTGIPSCWGCGPRVAVTCDHSAKLAAISRCPLLSISALPLVHPRCYEALLAHLGDLSNMLPWCRHDMYAAVQPPLVCGVGVLAVHCLCWFIKFLFQLCFIQLCRVFKSVHTHAHTYTHMSLSHTHTHHAGMCMECVICRSACASC